MGDIVLVLLFMALLYGIPELIRQMKTKKPQRPVPIPPMPPKQRQPKAEPLKAQVQREKESFHTLQPQIIDTFEPVTLQPTIQDATSSTCQDNIRRGILWAELISPPLALRRKQPKYKK